MMPTALPASTTTTHPIFSLTKESTTDLHHGGHDGLSSALLCSALLSKTERRVAREETDERGEK
jgi:hypothetical protein